MAYDNSAKVKALREYHEQEIRKRQTKIIAPTVSYNQSIGGSDTKISNINKETGKENIAPTSSTHGSVSVLQSTRDFRDPKSVCKGKNTATSPLRPAFGFRFRPGKTLHSLNVQKTVKAKQPEDPEGKT